MWCNAETSVKKMQNKLVHASISALDHDKCPTTLFYQRQNTHITKTILESKHQFNKIEILPKEKKCFSLTDFIIFASATYPKFFSTQPRRSTSKRIYLILTVIPNDKRINNEQIVAKDEHFSIQFESDKDFNEIHVFVKDHLDYFDRYGNMLFFQSRTSDYEIFDILIPRNESGLMILQFGKYVS